MLLILLLDKRENGKRDDIFSYKTHLDTSEDVDSDCIISTILDMESDFHNNFGNLSECEDYNC